MKISATLSMFLLASLFFFACKKSGSGGGGDAADGTIKARIDGSSFSTPALTTGATRITAGGITTIAMTGSDQSGKAISITLVGVNNTGTYAIGGGSSIAISIGYTEVNISNPTQSASWQAPYAGGEQAGEITITELSDTRIKGSFSSKIKTSAGNTKQITDGSFNIKFKS